MRALALLCTLGLIVLCAGCRNAPGAAGVIIHGKQVEEKGASNAMKINTIEVGALETNCYIVSDEKGNTAVIDPGAEPSRIIQFVENNAMSVKAIILTHTHHDHVGGLQALRERFKVPVIISEPEAAFFNVPVADMQPYSGLLEGNLFMTVKHGDKIRVGDITLQVLLTPGHTPGGACYKHGDDVFTGDTLFQDGVGRTDFPGGNTRQLMESIQKNLLALPDETRIYPGHGPSSTIGRERDYFGT